MNPALRLLLSAYISKSPHGECRKDMVWRAVAPDGTRLYAETRDELTDRLEAAVLGAVGIGPPMFPPTDAESRLRQVREERDGLCEIVGSLANARAEDFARLRSEAREWLGMEEAGGDEREVPAVSP